MFDPEGHLNLSPGELLTMAESSCRRLVNDYLLAGTPKVFQTYDLYCGFRTALADRLQIHPRAIVIRGSTYLGFSIAPRIGKVWRPVRQKSDIDIAITDIDYFARLDTEIRQWETRQRIPYYKSAEFKPYARRQEYRSFNCINDDDTLMPPNTCVAHKDIMQSFDTTPYCVGKREVSAFIFRDWWSLRNRYESDLHELCDGIKNGKLAPPPA